MYSCLVGATKYSLLDRWDVIIVTLPKTPF